MGEDDQRQQKAELLLEMDDQKVLIAQLEEKQQRQKEAFEAFGRALGFSTEIKEESERFIIGSQVYAKDRLNVASAIETKAQLKAARARASDLHTRAESIGIRLS